MKKCIVILLLFFSWISVIPLMAENNVLSTDFVHGRHSLRLGWGLGTKHLYNDYADLNTIIPPSYLPRTAIQGMTAAEAHEYLMNYRDITVGNPQQFGHLLLGYRYNVNSWFSTGVEIDWLYSWRHYEFKNGYGDIVSKSLANLHQLTLMPTVRFTYYHHPLVELYSGLGLGYTIYASESLITHGLTLYPTLFGINVGNQHWYAEIELGGMATLTNSWFSNPGILFSSRILSVAIGYRF